jgi:isocitrate dehydrogenase
MYWADALAKQNKDSNLKEIFTKIAADLNANEDQINRELLTAQGKPVDIGGYYVIDEDKISKAMRPSVTLNKIIDSI